MIHQQLPSGVKNITPAQLKEDDEIPSIRNWREKMKFCKSWRKTCETLLKLKKT